MEALYENDERVALMIDFNVIEMREIMDKLISRNRKSEFVEKCGEVLCLAQPHLIKCEYRLGKEMPSQEDEHYNEDDEYILVTCENGYTYALLITGNSLAAIGATIFSKMAHK